MKIPADAAERHLLYEKVRDQCLRTISERTDIYSSLRNWYLFGSGTGAPVKFNKIHPYVNLVTSYLYSQDTVLFSIEFGESVDQKEKVKLNAINKFVRERWEDTNADIIFGECVLWAEVYNTMIIKLIWWEDKLNVYAIPPNQFGVYREDVMNLDDQEAVVHITYISKTELAQKLEGHEKKEAILRMVPVIGKEEKIEQQISPFQQILINALNPNIQGNVPAASSESPLNQYVPEPNDEIVEIIELWIWDDDEHDYKTVTYCQPSQYIYERKNIFMPKEIPFGKVTPVPLHQYFYGESEVQHLAPLQDLRERRLGQLERLFALQARTPKAAMGMMGVVDEKLDALNDPGGLFSDTGMGNGKIEEFAPKLPEHPFEELAQIDEMFSEVSGITPILQGRGDSGVRAHNQASKMASLAASRPKRRALIIEDYLEKLATSMLKVYRQEYKYKLYDDNNQAFLLADIPDDFVVKVSAHSSSPVFIEDQKQMAAFMLKTGVISKRTFVELINPAMKETILEQLKKVEVSDARHQKMMEEAEMWHIRERGISINRKK